jgi:hypothetical protein
MGPGSEIRDPEKPNFGSRIQGKKGTGSRIRIRNTSFLLRKDFEDYADLLEAEEGEEEDEYAHQGQRLAQAGRDQRCVFKCFELLKPSKLVTCNCNQCFGSSLVPESIAFPDSGSRNAKMEPRKERKNWS